MSIAYQGGPGAFSHEACLAFAPDDEPVARPTFPDVAAAVLAGETGRGILPVENVYAGPVPGISDLLGQEGIEVLATHRLPVRLHLLALPGVRLEEVEKIISHPMALAQCSENLRALGLPIEEASNTALAAEALDRRDRAVLASESAAAAYGLDILRRDLHDRPDNATRFAIFARAEAS